MCEDYKQAAYPAMAGLPAPRARRQRLLQRRHLVCVASLREKSLDAALGEEVRDLQGALHAGAVARYLEQRTAAHEALRSHRVMVLDVTADELPAALVERYLAVKRDGVL